MATVFVALLRKRTSVYNGGLLRQDEITDTLEFTNSFDGKDNNHRIGWLKTLSIVLFRNPSL